MHARKTRDRTVGRTLTGLEYKPVLPSDGFGEWGRKEAMLGCREGARTDILEPRRSCPCSSLLSRNRETFIRRGFGVLKMVRFSRQRALQFTRVARLPCGEKMAEISYISWFGNG